MKTNKMKTYNKVLYEYVEPEELSSIIGKVRRERQNKKDDIMLSQYCYNQIQTYLSSPRKEKEKQHNDTNDNSTIVCTKSPEPPHSESKFWAEKKDLHKHIKVDLVNSTSHSCLCSCTTVKQDNISILSEVQTSVDNINNNSSDAVDVKSGNNKGDKNRSLGYSNIMLVSSHRDTANVNGDGTDANTEKLKTVRLKIKRFLDTILSNVDIFKSPEDDIEKVQLKQKAVEFCGRFSRNHLYEIGRALNETTKALNYCLPYNQWKHITSQSKSILNVHQVLLQAFSMFQRHMRIVWGYGDTHEKLHTLLQLTLEVNRICFPQQDKVDATFTDLQNGCNKLIENLNNIFGDDTKSCASKSTLYYKEITPGFMSRKMMAASSRMSNELNYSHQSTMNWTGGHVAAGDRYSMYRQQLPRRIAQNRKHSADIRNQKRTNNVMPRKSKSANGLAKNTTENNSRIIRQRESKSCPQICPPSLSGLFRKSQDVKNKKKIPTGNNKSGSRLKKCGESQMELIYPNTHLEALDECSNASDQRSIHEVSHSLEPLPESQETSQSKPCELTTSQLSERRDAIEDAAAAGASRYCETRPAGGGEEGREKNRNHTTISRSPSNNVMLLVLKHNESQDSEKEKPKEEPNAESIAKVESANVEFTEVSGIVKEKQNLRDSLIASFSKNILNAIKPPIPTHMQNSNEGLKEKSEDLTVRKKGESLLGFPANSKRKSPKENVEKKKVNFNCVPGEVWESIHNYRISYVKSLMDNPLYVHRNIKRPWEAVARISEKLIDDAIRTVAEEMEMEALLKQMVDVELKDFATISKT